LNAVIKGQVPTRDGCTRTSCRDVLRRVGYSTQATATFLDPPRPDRLSISFAVPAFDARGFFVLDLEPGSKSAGQARTGFMPYSDSFTGRAPMLNVEYSATPLPTGWRVVLRVLIPPADSTSS
jgi:hypothetical protein